MSDGVLKPSISLTTSALARNVGCDLRGDYKIFDFGLAKELKRKALVEAPDCFECTGLTGSRRWMAPENCLCKNYGLSADVYSFSMMFWHVISLQTPFPKYTKEKHMERVIVGGERPNTKKMRTSNFLRNIIAKGWAADCSQRPAMARICELLQLELLERRCENKRRRGSKNNIVDRSGYLMDQSMVSYFEGGNNNY